jgi:hypothetical protein
MSDSDGRSGLTRRGLLAGAGAVGAGLAAGPAGLLAGRPAAARAAAEAPARLGLPPGAPASSGFFGRMFPGLAPFADATDTVRAMLLEVGQPGGILDAGDDLAAGPKALITDPAVNGNPTAAKPNGTNPDNPTMTAGSTFVGQFTDHDITFDQTSQLGIPADPLTSPNTRTPALDLDSVFGGGPAVRPDLYVANPDGTVGPALQISTGGVHEDVPRVPAGDGTYTALLGDPRNDENLVIAGLHCAHILFYNQVLAQLGQLDLRHFPAARGADLSSPYARFLAARQVTQWHYQWLLVNEHLPQIAGQDTVTSVLENGTQFYTPRPATRSCRSSSAPPPTGSATPWSAPPTAPTSPAAPATRPAPPRTRSSRSSSTPPSPASTAPSPDPTSYLSAYPPFTPFLGTDLQLGPTPNPTITGTRIYTRAHFLHYAGVLTPGTYR